MNESKRRAFKVLVRVRKGLGVSSKVRLLLLALMLVLAVSSLFGCANSPQEPKNEAAVQNENAMENAADKGGENTALGAFSELEGTLDIAGGTAHIPVMEEAAKRIMTGNPEINISVAGGGSGVGVQKVGEGLVSIGNTGKALSDEEIAKYGLESFAFCIDGVAVIVHPDNKVQELTSKQVQDIYSGKIRNWSEVGGANSTINLFDRDEASGTREVFWKKALAEGTVDKGANIVASNGAMKTAISNDKNAIGYTSIGHVDSSVKAIILDGAEANQDNAKSGFYRVSRKLYMNTKGEPTGLTKAFIDYIMGPDGAEIITEAGFIPLN